MIKNNTIDKYVIWLSKDEYEQLSKKYQIEKLSGYIWMKAFYQIGKVLRYRRCLKNLKIE